MLHVFIHKIRILFNNEFIVQGGKKVDHVMPAMLKIIWSQTMLNYFAYTIFKEK